MTDFARLLIFIGLAFVLIGTVLLIAVRLFPWLGNLPGDLRFEGEQSQLYIPLTTMILISVLGTILLNIILRIFRR